MPGSLRAILRGIGVVALCSAAVPIATTVTILASLILLPLPATLPDPRPPAGGRITRVFDVNGDEIGQFREFEQNLPITKGDIPLHLKQAVIAAEDRNFYSHGGVDLRGSLRALSADVRGREIRQGGSTITQQYVKNAYTGRERTVGRKVREAILASQLDRRVDKDEILFKYLSSIYLGGGAYGVGAASETYFRKPVSQITLSEAALLAGVVPAPSRYDPRSNPPLAEQKRRLVLDKMLAQGYISPEEHAGAVDEELYLSVAGPPDRPATVVHPPQQPVSKFPYFVDYVRRYLESTLGRDAVYRGGLEIRTTLDPKVQGDAERAVSAGLAGTAPPISMSLVAVEPPTGYVRAVVGGRDFYGPEGQVNLALGKCAVPDDKVKDRVDVRANCWDPQAVVVEGGGTGRQPGSSWKPFVLAAAFEKGILDTRAYSAPSVYRIPNCRGDRCEIQNFEGAAGGRATLRRATVKSFNTVYAQLIQDVGVPEVGQVAKKLGVSTAWVANPEVHGISYALGAQEVAPLDMASAFGVFAARGMRAEATPVIWVKDPDGNFLEDNRKREPRRVLDEVIADNVTDVLREVITGGTGTRANIGRPAAGKTGTAQEFRDAWFVGYTPTLSTAVWIGNRVQPTPLRGIKGFARVTGGSIPAETWRTFMNQALKDVPPSDFTDPVPLKDFAEILARIARGGVDPGDKRQPLDAGAGGRYEVVPPPPAPTPPETTSPEGRALSDRRPPPSSTTTTTTISVLPRPP
jgi:penicillin-binding protein 1A